MIFLLASGGWFGRRPGARHFCCKKAQVGVIIECHESNDGVGFGGGGNCGVAGPGEPGDAGDCGGEAGGAGDGEWGVGEGSVEESGE